MIALAILILGLAFCIYLAVDGQPENEVINRIRREEGLSEEI